LKVYLDTTFGKVPQRGMSCCCISLESERIPFDVGVSFPLQLKIFRLLHFQFYKEMEAAKQNSRFLKIVL
jgi:hypothetical protein